MDCNVIRVELASFHFGELDDEARRGVELHLASCRSCLQAFLALKRAIETNDARPSETARARLRAAVARQIAAARQAAPAWSWWQRPLAVAVAAGAVVLAVSTVSALASSPGGAPRGWSKLQNDSAP